MNPLSQSLKLAQIDWSLLQSLLDSSSLHLVLMAGAGILALSLLTLALTGLGASRPVLKCAFLSIMAHVLLVGFAWKAQLVEPEPKKELTLSEPMRVNFSEDQGQLNSTGETPQSDPIVAHSSEKAWDRFAVEAPLPGLDSDALRPATRGAFAGRDFSAAPDRRAIPAQLAAMRTQRPENPIKNTVPWAMPEAPAMLKDAIEIASADRGNVMKNDRQRVVRQNRLSSIAAMESPPMVPDRPAPSVEVTSPRGESALKVAANVFEKGEFTSSDKDSVQTPPAIEGSFEPIAEPPASAAQSMADVKPLPAELNRPKAEEAFASEGANQDPLPVVRVDGTPVPEVYSLRTQDKRMQAVMRQGGSRQTEEAVQQALVWLHENQSRDGRWNPRLLGGGREDLVLGHDRDGAGANSDSGITALALLAFMANGHTHLEGPYKNSIQTGLEYLIAQQSKDGDLAGKAKLFARMYCHSMSLLALSEAYGLTGDRRLAVAVQRGVNYSVAAQDKREGGWRYQPGDEGDMSQFGWQVMALHSAETAGVDISGDTKERMVDFLNGCCGSPHKGIASYRRGQGPSTTMTAEALFCRSLLGQPLLKPTLDEAHSRIGKQLPSVDNINMYYWYYGTLACYVTGGDVWETWNQQMKDALLSLQVQSGPDKGSWEPNGLWAGYGGRTYSTAMAALTLEVYYRYLPVYDIANRHRASELR